MIIYSQETDDGLSQQLATSTMSYASLASPCSVNNLSSFNNKISNKVLSSYNDQDLYYVQSILVSSSWNKNDDIFDKNEVWKAKSTPEDKPTNLEHNENLIIGHIISNWAIDDDGQVIPEEIMENELPDKYHIVTGSVIYRAFSDQELKARAEKLISEIENGTKYVSMECYFNGFDYGLIDTTNGQYKILLRNNETAYLTKHLRAYGGKGEHENYKIGRVLRSITFSGKGFVDKPANPDSIIFNKNSFFNEQNKKSYDLYKKSVITTKSNYTVEKIIMNDNFDKQVAELNSKMDRVSANCTDTVKEISARANDLQNTNQALEAAVKTKDEEMKKMKAAQDSKEEEIKKMKEKAAQDEEDKKKMKASFDLELESEAKKWQEEKAVMEDNLKKIKSELDAANETIAAMMTEKEEFAKKEKKMKRMASLVDAGLDSETASSTLDNFVNVDDSAFDAMVAILAAMKPAKKEETAMMNPKMKKMASEEMDSALDNVESEDTVDLSVGEDSVESQDHSVRAELLEFVSARLNKNSK